MHGFRLISRHAILGHTPYLSGSSGFVCLCRQTLIEMSGHILIFGGFHQISIGWHTCHTWAYPLSARTIRNLFVCAYSHYREDESCYDIFWISSCFDRCHIGAYPLPFGIIWRWWFVQAVFIEDMSHCYDIFGLHHVSVGCHTMAYPSNFAFTIFSSDVQASSSVDHAFRLRLHMDKMFKLHMYHTC